MKKSRGPTKYKIPRIEVTVSREHFPKRYKPTRVCSPEEVISALGERLRAMPSEVFCVVLLDASGRMLGVDEIARGTLTACLVHPREVFRSAIVAGAASIVVAHNHPSGILTPSDEDLALTRRLVDSGVILGIPVNDHIIVSHEGWRSIISLC